VQSFPCAYRLTPPHNARRSLRVAYWALIHRALLFLRELALFWLCSDRGSFNSGAHLKTEVHEDFPAFTDIVVTVTLHTEAVLTLFGNNVHDRVKTMQIRKKKIAAMVRRFPIRAARARKMRRFKRHWNVYRFARRRLGNWYHCRRRTYQIWRRRHPFEIAIFPCDISGIFDPPSFNKSCIYGNRGSIGNCHIRNKQRFIFLNGNMGLNASGVLSLQKSCH